MGEPQAEEEVKIAPLCQHEIYALAERLGFRPTDHVQEIVLAPSHIDVITVDVDDKGQKQTQQVGDHQELATTTTRFSYSRYGTLWEHSHE